MSVHQKILEASPDLVFVVDASMNVRFASPSLGTQLGWSQSALIGQPATLLVPPSELDLFQAVVASCARGERASAAIELQMLRADGSRLWTEGVVAGMMEDVEVGGVVVNVRDIDERRDTEHLLLTKAFHDEVTGIATRALFLDRLQQAVRMSAHDLIVKVLYLAIDDYVDVQRDVGWQHTDELLRQLAERLQRALPTETLLGHFSAHTFLIASTSIEGNRGELVSLIRDEVSRPFVVGAHSHRISVSTGLASATRGEVTSSQLVHRAQAAAHEARRLGRGQAVAYNDTLDVRSQFREATKSDLQRALEEDELRLHFQPIVAADSGRVAGIEALVRWEHPERGLVAPSEFITIADETGMIDPIGSWVLIESLRALGELHQHTGDTSTFVTVNVSERQLASIDFISQLRATLSRTGIDPRLLHFDLSEATLGRSNSLIGSRLREIRDLGIAVALDDFGSGYSSLAALRNAPISHVKIDRAFTSSLGDGGLELVSGIIVLAHALGLSTVAEGVETEEEFETLRRIGCSLTQGWYHARPMPLDELQRSLRSGDISLGGKHEAATGG